MTYNIKITDTQTDLAQSLLFYLMTIAKTPEYSFLQIEEIPNEEKDLDLLEELDTRYEHFMENKLNFKDWDDIRGKYLNL